MNTGVCGLAGQASTQAPWPQSLGLCQTNSAAWWPVEELQATSFLSLCWSVVFLHAPLSPFVSGLTAHTYSVHLTHVHLSESFH